MTGGALLFYISAAILFQVAVYILVAVSQHREGDRIVSTEQLKESPKQSSAAWPGWREFRVTRREYEDGDQSQCSFYLEPLDGVSLPAFKPGQFLTFQLAIAKTGKADGDDSAVGAHTIVRCYSLSDRPEPSCYRVTIKRIPSPLNKPETPPGLASNYFHDHVQVGTVLKVKAPAGHFFIDPDPTINVALIAGGIGITPMLSMLRWCIENQSTRNIYLYFGLRRGGEHPFKIQLEQLASDHPNFRLNVLYSQPSVADVQDRDFQHVGRIDVDLLRRTLPHGRHQFYICGPAAMMESLVPAIASWGVLQDDIRFEAFGPASVHLNNDANSDGVAQRTDGAVAVTEQFEIKFLRSARTLVWDSADASLLDFAERNGVEVESGCRAGSCGSCEVKLVSGKIHYASTPDYDIAPGHCLLCVGRPVSSMALEA
jgi:uncharacterized protein